MYDRLCKSQIEREGGGQDKDLDQQQEERKLWCLDERQGEEVEHETEMCKEETKIWQN